MKKISKQNLASWLERLFAHLIDQLLIVVPYMLIQLMFGTGGLTLLLTFLCSVIYFTYFTSSPWQASPGQRILSVYVVHQDGRRMSTTDALERTLVYCFPQLPMYTSLLDEEIAKVLVVWLVLLWFLPIVISEKRTGVHDRICNTRVVVGKADAA